MLPNANLGDFVRAICCVPGSSFLTPSNWKKEDPGDEVAVLRKNKNMVVKGGTLFHLIIFWYFTNVFILSRFSVKVYALLFPLSNFPLLCIWLIRITK